jgi:hypothetical protein
MVRIECRHSSLLDCYSGFEKPLHVGRLVFGSDDRVCGVSQNDDLARWVLGYLRYQVDGINKICIARSIRVHSARFIALPNRDVSGCDYSTANVRPPGDQGCHQVAATRLARNIETQPPERIHEARKSCVDEFNFTLSTPLSVAAGRPEDTRSRKINKGSPESGCDLFRLGLHQEGRQAGVPVPNDDIVSDMIAPADRIAFEENERDRLFNTSERTENAHCLWPIIHLDPYPTGLVCQARVRQNATDYVLGEERGLKSQVH